MIRVTAAVLLCLIATAFFPSRAAASIPCWAVKAAVASYGVAGAESLAKRHGYTDAEIVEARKCLHR